MMSRENVAYAIATFAGVALLFTIGLSRPDLLVEDGLVENLSAVGFAAASLLALCAALLGRVSLTFAERSILAGTGALSLLLFLSEISFSARIFDIQMPRMRGGGEFDGGHDIAILIFRQLRDAGRTGALVAAVGGGLLLAAAFALLFRFRRQARTIAGHILSKAFEFRLAMALGMLACAVVLDVIPSYKASILEEILEFSASIVLILSVSAFLASKGAGKVFLASDRAGNDVFVPFLRQLPATNFGPGGHRANPPRRENSGVRRGESDHDSHYARPSRAAPCLPDGE